MSNHALAVMPPQDTSIIEEVVAKGDLKALSAEDRARYYVAFCRSVGLNPQTQPMQYVVLNGKLTLYATKGATDQLRKLHGVSVTRIDKETVDDLYVVTVAVRDRDGRTDEDMGAVVIAGLTGDAKVNAMLKAISKAKRRATLSLCGLPLLDETEIETVPSARAVVVDTATGEILDGASARDAPSPTTPAPPGTDRDGLRRQFFAAITAAGVTHPDAQKALCTQIFPAVQSRAGYTATMWADATAWISDEANAATVAHYRELSWLARIEACTTEAALGTLATELGASGQATDVIRAAFRVRREELQAAARLTTAAT